MKSWSFKGESGEAEDSVRLCLPSGANQWEQMPQGPRTPHFKHRSQTWSEGGLPMVAMSDEPGGKAHYCKPHKSVYSTAFTLECPQPCL